jgi:putative FmdB family regulatory protein
MPIYEYRCGACGHELEALQKMADEPLSDCPECAASALKRLVSAPNFRLKGGGWYETDFKSDSDTKRNLADKGDQPKSAGDSDAKSGDPSKSKSDGKSEGDASKATPAEKPKPKPSVDTSS